MKKILMSAIILAGLTSSASFANEELIKNIKSMNDGRFSNASVKVLREVPLESMRGFYEVTIDGQTLIVNKNGRDAVVGELYDLDQMVNITAEYRAEQQSKIAKEAIGNLKEDNFVTFKPHVDKIGTMYVFTDPTCGYCKKVHEELGDYLSAGVEVKYIPYPRGGAVEGSRGYDLTKQYVCAKDQQAAINAIENGTAGDTYVQEVYDDKCLKLIDEGLRAGEEIGITGTPFIYLSNELSIPGYNPSEKIISLFK